MEKNIESTNTDIKRINNKIVDFHTHIIPNIDDGSSSYQETKMMIQTLFDSGVKSFVVTPHFYAENETPEIFLKRRENAINLLKKNLVSENISFGSTMYVGVEVEYFENISFYDNLENLCIQGTNTLLLELPFNKMPEIVLKEILNIKDRGFTPLIAHCERYVGFAKFKNLFDLFFEYDIPVQCNCNFFLKQFQFRNPFKLLEKRKIAVIGSDCHNMNIRKPNISQAIEKIEKNSTEFVIENIVYNQNQFLKNANKIYI